MTNSSVRNIKQSSTSQGEVGNTKQHFLSKTILSRQGEVEQMLQLRPLHFYRRGCRCKVNRGIGEGGGGGGGKECTSSTDRCNSYGNVGHSTM